MFFVYVIKSKQHDWYYVGSTENITKRFLSHNKGYVKSTKSRRPYKLIYVEKLETLEDARSREKEIKSKRKLKEEIIRKHGPIV